MSQPHPGVSLYVEQEERKPSSPWSSAMTPATPGKSQAILWRYGVAVCSVAVAILLRSVLTPLWGDKLPFITLYPAVFLTAWYGGLGPGVFSTVLSILTAAYLWMVPVASWSVDAFADWIGLLVAMSMMLLVTSLTATLRRTQQALEERVAVRTAELAYANATLQREVAIRSQIEKDLRTLNADLDQRVRERTAALTESEERFATLFHANPVPMTLLSVNDGCFRDVNHAVLRESGYLWDELVGPAVSTLPVFANPAQLLEFGRLLQHPQEVQGADLRLRSKTGVERDYLAYATLITLDGQPYLLGAMIDVTLRKQAEEALARHARDLALLNADLRQIAYVTAHDLQEPVRQVSVYTQLLAHRYDASLDAVTHEAITFIVEAAQRMAAQLNDLMHYLEVDDAHIDQTATDCEIILQRALAELHDLIITSQATITHDPLPTLIVNPRLLQLVFQELLDNALKFHENTAPRVHVWAERVEGSWRFAVRDNGIGIDPQYVGRLFGFFKRLEHSRYPGTGMGLAICKKIVERHGGRIWIEATPGGGTTIQFTVSGEAQPLGG